MNKGKVINILKSFEYYVDDDWGGYYTSIDCSQRATTPLGILKILDYIDDLNNENSNYKQVLNEIENYIESLPTRKQGLFSFIPTDVKEHILQIIDKALGDE